MPSAPDTESSERKPAPKEQGPKPCVYCGEDVRPGALLCSACSHFQPPKKIARLRAFWGLRVINALLVGIIAFLLTSAYRHATDKGDELTERAQRFATSAIDIQITLEQLMQPCPHASRPECAARFQTLSSFLSKQVYVFKDEAKAIFRNLGADEEEAGIFRAISFVDGFYNPGEMSFTELLATPLQIQVQRAEALHLQPLGRRDAEDGWCSVEGRQTIRALMTSINTFRYCYGAIRRCTAKQANKHAGYFDRYVRGPLWGFDWDKPAQEGSAPWKTCTSNSPLRDKVNEIVEKVGSLQNMDWGAPWNYDAACGDSTALSVQGGSIPLGTKQLVVVTTDTWDSDSGRLSLLERLPNGDFERTWGPIDVAVGRNGLGWGRGLHPFPAVRQGTQQVSNHSEDEEHSIEHAIKIEGDGRAPAGLFGLGPLYIKKGGAAAAATKLIRYRPLELFSSNTLVCDDRVDSPKYNTIWNETKAELDSCSSLGNCPELVVRPDNLYDLFVVIEHNSHRTPGGGSCIFLHISRPEREPTAGCTAMPRNEIVELAKALDHRKQPLLLQLPIDEYQRRQASWNLPDWSQVRYDRSDSDK